MPRKSRQEARGTAKVELLKTEEEKGKYTKVCAYCHHTYSSNARGQRFCCTEHQKLYAKRIKENRARYKEIAPVERLRVSAHNLAVSVVKVECELGFRKWKCECCGAEEKIIVHHSNLDWLDNNSSNLKLLCEKCHSAEHSRIEKEQAAKGLSMDEFYPKDFVKFARIINKDKFE